MIKCSNVLLFNVQCSMFKVPVTELVEVHCIKFGVLNSNVLLFYFSNSMFNVLVTEPVEVQSSANCHCYCLLKKVSSFSTKKSLIWFKVTMEDEEKLSWVCLRVFNKSESG